MLWKIAAVCAVVWALGLITANTAGGFIHLLPCVSIALIAVQIIRGAKVFAGGTQKRKRRKYPHERWFG